MTNDGTQVSAEELAAFGTAAHDRAARTTSAAETVAGVHLGSDMLGAFSLMFLESARADHTEITANLRATATGLTDDGDSAITNSKNVENLEATQTSQFTDKELP